MAGATGRESDKFMLRLPEGMRDRIKAEGDKNGRSMNAEIISRLESTLTYAPSDNVQAATSTRLERTILRQIEDVIEKIAKKHGV
ncbi:Arc family DNA-binding protein [Paracoccus rhizosphaerae]|uniref:Arc family DNA-binding protein n=1 Tax=Paracoccus rhizosphaerae TaxID=1133347 RepID=A0ABV6CL02_9RHOB